MRPAGSCPTVSRYVVRKSMEGSGSGNFSLKYVNICLHCLTIPCNFPQFFLFELFTTMFSMVWTVYRWHVICLMHTGSSELCIWSYERCNSSRIVPASMIISLCRLENSYVYNDGTCSFSSAQWRSSAQLPMRVRCLPSVRL